MRRHEDPGATHCTGQEPNLQTIGFNIQNCHFNTCVRRYECDFVHAVPTFTGNEMRGIVQDSFRTDPLGVYRKSYWAPEQGPPICPWRHHRATCVYTVLLYTALHTQSSMEKIIGLTLFLCLLGRLVNQIISTEIRLIRKRRLRIRDLILNTHGRLRGRRRRHRQVSPLYRWAFRMQGWYEHKLSSWLNLTNTTG